MHPLSPLLRGLRYVVIAIAAISWQGFRNLGPERWAMAVAGVAVLVLIGSLVSYLVTGYHVVGRELRVYEGLFVRRTRAIPVERLQSVELVQPAIARLFGLAELRLEVVGGNQTEAPLAYLTRDEAITLRRRLLNLAAAAQPAAPSGVAARAAADQIAGPAPVGAPTGDLAAPATDVAGPSERLVHVINNRDLVVSQLLRPQWWLLPIAVAVPIVDAFFDGQLGFFSVASTVTAVIGAVSAPVRVLLGDWRFTLAQAADGLRIRRGLLETRSSTVPEGRIQSVLIEWPLLWRLSGWVRASMHVAGVRGEQNQQGRSSLLPVATVDVAGQVVATTLPGVVLRDIVIRPVPERAKWFAPLRRRFLGYHLGPAAFASRDGLLTRRLMLVPYGRIQSVRIRQGPLQRRLGLATVFVDVAGGGAPGVAPHLDVAEARALAQALAEHSRAARRSTAAPTGGTPAAPTGGTPAAPTGGTAAAGPTDGASGAGAPTAESGTTAEPGPLAEGGSRPGADDGQAPTA
ncbi:MAG: PH domain-containing protein [Dactylosporangium sp.]|nr:PH domain-containing protein [Dactylosporangium sp.]